MGFKYILTLVKDGRYGNKDDDGNWKGMIGELVRQVCQIFNVNHWGGCETGVSDL